MIYSLSDKKLYELTELFSKEIQHLSGKVLRFKKTLPQAQLLDSSSLQEISNLMTQVSKSIESKSTLPFHFDSQAILNKLDHDINRVSNILQNYIKPIKTGIKAGEILPIHGHLTSENRIFNLVMQKDRNLVLYKFATPIWNTYTHTDNWDLQPELILNKEDGTLKIRTINGDINVWSMDPNEMKDPYLVVTNSGAVKIMDSEKELLNIRGNIPLITSYFSLGEQLNPEDAIVSENEIYTLVLQHDYNLVLYEHSNPIWNSGTFDLDHSHKYAIRLTDQGSLVLQSWDRSSEFVIVPPHPSYQGKVTLSVADDGAIIINGENIHLWNSKK